MEIKEVQNKKIEVITDVICDCCGKSCKVYECIIENDVRVDNGEPYYIFEFMDIKVNWGYHSENHLQTWTAQVCEKCVIEKFSFINFKKEKYL